MRIALDLEGLNLRRKNAAMQQICLAFRKTLGTLAMLRCSNFSAPLNAGVI